MDVDRLRRVAGIAAQDAEARRVNAGYGGSTHDGGASIVKAKLEGFRAGLDRRIPVGWEVYAQQEDLEYQNRQRALTDPDYAKWLELNKRFGQSAS